MNPQVTTAENELRTMVGDLMMQLAMLRAENINLKIALDQLKPPETGKANGMHPSGDQPNV